MAEQTDRSVDVRQRLANFSAMQGRVEYPLFAYGPLLVLGQLNITGLAGIMQVLYERFSPNPQLISWAVYSPIYAGVLLTLFVESLCIRSFLFKIPETFTRLWNGGAIAGSDSDERVTRHFDKFLDDFENKLNNRGRLWLGLPFAILGLFFFWRTGHLPHTVGRWFDDSDLAAKLVTTLVNTFALFVPAVAVGYAIGVGVWKSIVTGLYVRRFSKSFDLVIQTAHPDKAGGLSPLGDLILALATILVVASLALSGLIIGADYVAFVYTEAFSKAFLGLVLVLSLITFFLPLITAHDRMVAKKKEQESLLADIAHRIAELEQSTRTNLREMDYEERKKAFEEIDVLTELYRRTASIPTWPFGRDVLLRFVTPQVFSLLSLIGIAEPIVGAIRSFVLALTGNQP